MKKRLIALMTCIALAMLTIDVRAVPGTQGAGAQSARIGVPLHAGRLEASAPSKAWESPALHQSARHKATPETITPAPRSVNAAAMAFAGRAVLSGINGAELPRRVSPRAPPTHSISL